MDKYDELNKILSDIQSDEHVQEMKKYIQHGDVSTYEHCEKVAKLCYNLNRKLPLHADMKTLLVGPLAWIQACGQSLSECQKIL